MKAGAGQSQRGQIPLQRLAKAGRSAKPHVSVAPVWHGLADALMKEMNRYMSDATVKERLTEMHHSLIADTPNLCAQAIETVRRQVRSTQSV